MFFILPNIPTASDRMDSVNQRQNQWKFALLVGILDIVIGILLIIYKRESLNVILIISGVLLAATGALVLISGIKDKVTISIVVGAIFLALGIAMILLPNLFAGILMVLLAIMLLLFGIAGVLSTFDKEGELASKIISLAVAALMIAAGIIVLFNIDHAEDWVMIITGIMMVFTGVINFMGGVVQYKALNA